MEQQPITINALVAADMNTVWDCWTMPAHIIHWNFAAAEWHCPKAENDLRIGGKFNSRMEARDGSFGFDFEGVYDQVVPREKIAYSLGDGRKVTILFEKLGNNIKVTETFDPEQTNPLDIQRDGWQAILNNFKRYAEGK